MPTTRAQRFCDTQPTTYFALLRIQLIIPPMIPGNASAALIPNRSNSNANALSLDLIHSARPDSSVGGGSPPPDAAAAPPPGNNASMSTPMAIHPNSCEYRSNRNSLFSKQSSDLFGQRGVTVQNCSHCFFEASNLGL